jgi:hypothetical protein
MHASFVNAGNWAFPPPITRKLEFGMHVYGPFGDVNALHASSLYGAAVFIESLDHDGIGEIPRVKYQGHWDLRPHRARIIHVDDDRLKLWRELLDRRDHSLDETPLVHAVTSAELGAMAKLAACRTRLGDRHPQISSGYHEMGAKKQGIICEDVSDPKEWSEVVLQGPHIYVATPFAKQPPRMGSHDEPQHLATLPADAVPATKYRRACDLETYCQAQDRWVDHSLPEPTLRKYSEYYRVAWRKMIQDSNERSLVACLIPPGPAHIDALISMALESDRLTTLAAGFWASVTLDYLLRVTGKSNLHASDARMMPVPQIGHPLVNALLLRTLRLNCLTDAYVGLWRELYDPQWQVETWAGDWPSLQPLGLVVGEWSRDTPLRTEYARRAALVEIDALVAVWLGWEIEELLAAYESRFNVLAGYEEEMYFDAKGRKIASNWNTFGGGQTKEHWKQFEFYVEDPDRNPPPERYTPPFYKADRIAEYRQAHAVFSERLRREQAGGE